MRSFLVIENDDLMRLSLRVIIEQVDPGTDIVEAQNFQDAISLLSVRHFDLVILQTSVDHGSGIRMLQEIRGKDPETAVLICAVGDERLPHAERYLLQGANGFIVKSATREEIVAAISMVLKGKRYVSEQIHADILSRNLPVERYRRALTKREDQVLQLTLQGRSTSEIAHTLSIHRNAVSAFKVKILRKMQVNSIVDLIHIFGRHPQAGPTRPEFQGTEGDSGNLR